MLKFQNCSSLARPHLYEDCFHIGGDQLTRERFSGAKRLRAGTDNIQDKWKNCTDSNTKGCKERENVEKTDGILNYATLVLNLGLLYKELLSVCKLPDRKRLIRLMKQCLIVFKAKSNLSKYALEVLRFLMQQTVLLSEKSATMTVYSMFVNTQGKIDSHIPADLQMEYIVKLTKKYIKHVFSNKSSQNISKKTRALSSIESVCDNFDQISDVKVRCKNHSHASYY
ncbi:unnamed protein product [Mytilus coruscus]|uniref:DUF6589 domain-containing protein n=1 Tax=Mytilus coruscus TaxID=42192 RepID=A0A6J8B102_MYTCO|nr:unnamed protein product [Mytilus coruscus]